MTRGQLFVKTRILEAQIVAGVATSFGGADWFDANFLVAWTWVTLPWTGSDGVVLPLLAAAYKVHDEAKEEHDEAPGEVEINAHGFFVDGRTVASDEAVDAHEAADEQEDQAEGDADVESHGCSLVLLDDAIFPLNATANTGILRCAQDDDGGDF